MLLLTATSALAVLAIATATATATAAAAATAAITLGQACDPSWRSQWRELEQCAQNPPPDGAPIASADHAQLLNITLTRYIGPVHLIAGQTALSFVRGAPSWVLCITAPHSLARHIDIRPKPPLDSNPPALHQFGCNQRSPAFHHRLARQHERSNTDRWRLLQRMAAFVARLHQAHHGRLRWVVGRRS